MDHIDCTWMKFRDEITSDIRFDKKFIYRGHSNNSWKLRTNLHRTGQWKTPEDIVFYMERIVPLVHETVAAWEGRKRNLTNPFELAQFIAYLQHNGFPTPLLDWTYSPYIAAYFAFEGINHFEPQTDFVSIYCFDKESWLKEYAQSYNYKDTNIHVSILEPSFVDNPKQLLQQSTFMYTNQDDIEAHIELNQKGRRSPFLRKYRFHSKERLAALRELRLMNITAIQLFPSLESVCKKVAMDIALLFPVGKTRSEITTKLIEDLLKLKTPT